MAFTYTKRTNMIQAQTGAAMIERAAKQLDNVLIAYGNTLKEDTVDPQPDGNQADHEGRSNSRCKWLKSVNPGASQQLDSDSQARPASAKVGLGSSTVMRSSFDDPSTIQPPNH